MSTLTKRLICFFCFTYIFTWFFWGISLLDSNNIITSPIPPQLLGIIGSFGPSLVGIVFLIKYEKQKAKDILTNTFVLKGHWSWKIFAFAFMPLILGISYLITRFVFGITYELEWFDAPLFIPVVYFYILFLGGPLGEEIGWRGYALKKMLKVFNPFSASIILGLIWTFWHLPAFFIEGSAQQGISFYLYSANTLILSLLITILYIKTNYRISAAMYFHASSNFALGIFYIIDEPLGLTFIAIFMLSTIIYLLIKYKSIYFSKVIF